MEHEALPKPERTRVKVAFWELIAPNVRPVVANKLGAALGDGYLTDAAAVRLLCGLWANDEIRKARLEWADREDGWYPRRPQ